MAPNDDVERPRASSAAERQKSIVSMTEFEGMDEYTALQKYILFYRDTRTNPHAEQTTKKKAWWQFWKSGSATAATPIQDAGAVPDDCKFYHPAPSFDCMHLASHSTAVCGSAQPASPIHPLLSFTSTFGGWHGPRSSCSLLATR